MGQTDGPAERGEAVPAGGFTVGASAPPAAVPGAILPAAAPTAGPGVDPVGAEVRRAFAAHPDLIYGSPARAAALHATFAELRRGADTGDGLALLADLIGGLPEALGRTAPGLQCSGVIALRTPAIFFRTADPLLAAVVDACGSGSYAHRERPWGLRACFADPDQEATTDFPFLFGPEAGDWQDRRAICELDAWRIAFGVFLFGRSRDREGRPLPEARTGLARPARQKDPSGGAGPPRPS